MTVDEIINQYEMNGRICPQPLKWKKMWELLRNKERKGNRWKPPLPLILQAWHFTSDFEKKIRLIEHLKWAVEQNQLNEIIEFLSELDENDWYHENE